MAERRALLIGVSGFTEAADELLFDLDFAAPAIEELSEVLRDGFGYSVTVMTEPGLTTNQLSEVVRQALFAAGQDDIFLLHLLTHGVARGNLLYALGSDGIIDERAEVGTWLAGLQHAHGRPLGLLSLDMCHSGIVTQQPWQAGYDSGGRRGWVMAACEPDRRAFDGLFTRALTTVLRELANKEIEVGPDNEFVPLQTVARAVRGAVVTMARGADSYQQYVVASRLDLSVEAPTPPFFPNPLHGEATEERRPSPADPSLLAYLQDADFGHFIENASGSAVISDLTGELTGCFSGREHELRTLSRWLNDAGGSRLTVVTGSPGAGKSALLGVLICAAHPALRVPTGPIWRVASAAPVPAELLAAVDAGERSLAAIADALGRQLGLSGDIGPDSLLAALSRMSGRPPVLVIDSLDEAGDAGEVASWLISLASLTRPDGSAAARLLVGTRAYEESAALRELAEESPGGLHDLDAVSDRVLEDDLNRYVTNLLRATPEYRPAHQVTGAFAGKLAETLARRRARGWGEFLVAGLFTRQFISIFQRADGPGAAERLASTVPRTLPEVLELDLARQPDDRWLRSTLRAVAYARGKGMPGSVILRVAAALGPGLEQPSPADIVAALRAGRLYLRRSVDREKVTVYRLFHDGLGERLRRPEEAGPVYRAILAVTGQADRRTWSAAEPYVLEHALDHAANPAELLDDPGFLVYARRDRYLASLSGRARLLVEDVHPADPILVRRAVMARAAVESGQRDTAGYLAELPGEQPLPWRPLWAVGARADIPPSAAVALAALDARGRLRVWVRGPDSPDPEELPDTSSFALTRQDGSLVIVTGDLHGTVRVIRPGASVVTLATHDAVATALAVAEYGEDLVVVSASGRGTVLTHALSTGQEVRGPVSVSGPVSALAVGGNAMDPIGACATAAGELWTWRIKAEQDARPYGWALPSAVRSVTVTTLGDRAVILVGCDDGTARSLDCDAHMPLKVLPRHVGPVLAVAVEIVGGRTVAVTGDPSGHVQKWDLLTGRPNGEPLKVCRGPVTALALRATSAGLLCFVGGKGVSGTVLWDLDEGRRQRDFGRIGATSVALSVDHVAAARRQGQRQPSAIEFLVGVDGLRVVIIGHHDGAAQAMEFDSGVRLDTEVEGDGDPVTSIGIVQLGGMPTAVIRSDHTTRLWQPGRDSVVVSSRGTRTEALNQPWRNAILVDSKLVTVTQSRTGALTIDGDTITEDRDVTVVVVTHLDGRPVALAGDRVGWVRIWDLADRRVLDELNVGAPVFAIAATTDGRLAVGAGGRVYAFRRVNGHQREA